MDMTLWIFVAVVVVAEIFAIWVLVRASQKPGAADLKRILPLLLIGSVTTSVAVIAAVIYALTS